MFKLMLLMVKKLKGKTMSKTVYYRQCRLSNGTARQVSWIPEKYAIKNKILKLKENGKWINGWKVDSAGTHLLAEDMLPDPHQEIKSHRKATGDSMKKVKKD